MLLTSALPIGAAACCNPRMFQGKDLGAAIVTAMERKALQRGVAKITQAELAEVLGIKQPSVSELLKDGRLEKAKIPVLLEFFADVVGPDHFGLPYSKFEADFIAALRKLPRYSQNVLLERVQHAADQVEVMTNELQAPLYGVSQKQPGAAKA